jgi:hypothetical protein
VESRETGSARKSETVTEVARSEELVYCGFQQSY